MEYAQSTLRLSLFIVWQAMFEWYRRYLRLCSGGDGMIGEESVGLGPCGNYVVVAQLQFRFRIL